MSVVVIHGSPQRPSRSSALANYIASQLEQRGIEIIHIRLDDIPADALLRTQTDAPAIARYLQAIQEASGVIIATPVYTGSVSALTKGLLEIIPERGLRGRPALVLASGGSAASVQAAEHALTPVLRNLKATLLGASVYSATADLPSEKDNAGNTISYYFNDEVKERLDEALDHFLAQLPFTDTTARATDGWASRLAL